jgi:hypothetical protein
LFSFEGEDFAYLNIDPASPWAIHYKAEQFAVLRQWARMVGMDGILHRVQNLPEVPETDRQGLLHFQHYYIVVNENTDGPRIGLAPDAQQRHLAAVFTAELACEKYLEWRQGHLQDETVNVYRLQLTGADLYRELASMDLDGIVFNCMGPLRPRAFSNKLSQFVLQPEVSA